ncbi:MAG: hypothetical protein FDZ75_05655 [Actinobacteria bacterium]|nr:MAG: hypothetical protein FDZ75_05655 [Actinomycetota bacterium]
MSDAPVLSGVNAVDDVASAGDFEKKHTPFLSAVRDGERVTVTIEVGHWVAHPNQPDHFIQWIDVQVAGASVARFDFSPVAADPSVTCVLNVDPGATITALENCNLHGVWAASTPAP